MRFEKKISSSFQDLKMYISLNGDSIIYNPDREAKNRIVLGPLYEAYMAYILL